MIRTRFAPSPTGFLHVGGLRTALYNYLLAKKSKGQFILRIEDTDQERIIEGAVEDIITSLKICGLEFDEGPDVDGKYAPYIQSQRLNIYKKHVDQLLSEGKAYPCFCSPERLSQMRQKQLAAKIQPKYDRHCLNLSPEEIARHEKSNTPFVVRFKIPEINKIDCQDLVRGKVEFSGSTQDDFVMLKSDGFPTYHLANIVDDHLMQISHVIRGDEWLSSLPKHLLLYQAFGWSAPQFAHIPLLLGKNREKLSKRHGDVAVKDYLAKGYLPEALINFVALLGWNPGTDREIFSLKELVKEFDIEELNKSGAVFDLEKLDWMNGYYIRQAPLKKIVALSLPYLEKAQLIKKTDREKYQTAETGETVSEKFLEGVIKLERERIKHLSELPELTDFLFKEKLDYPADLLRWQKTDLKKTRAALELLLKTFEEIPEKDFTAEKLHSIVEQLAKDNGLKNGELFWPWRVALTGRKASPGPQDISEVIGKIKTLERISSAIAALTPKSRSAKKT